MYDLELAIVHHMLAFALAAILGVELALVSPTMNSATIRRVAAIDLGYGALATLLLIVGFARAKFAAKGWAYYSHNLFFWAKISAFVIVGLLSVPPTLRYLGWHRAVRANPAARPSENAVRAIRRLLWIEAAVFALIPIFAAAMARGYGQL